MATEAGPFSPPRAPGGFAHLRVMLVLSLACQLVSHAAHGADAPAEAPPTEPALDPADARARSLFLLGDELYGEGRYPEAVRAFLEAHRLSQRAGLLFNAANALERWGCHARAATQLRRYANTLAPDRRDSILKRIAVLQSRPAALDRGMPSCDGGADDARRADRPVVGTDERAGAVSERPSTPSVLGYSLMGLSAVAIAGGLYFGLSSSKKTNRANERCLDSGLCPTSAEDVLEASRSDALLADVGVGIGLAALASGLFLVYESSKSPHVGGAVNATGTVVHWSGRF